MRTIGEIPRKTPVEPKKEELKEVEQVSVNEQAQPTDSFDESVIIN